MEEIEALKHQLQQLNDELEAKNKEIHCLTVTDPLTGLYNRVRLNEILDHEKNRFDRYSHPFAVVLVDIDHFRQVNDNHGQEVGNRILVELAGLLKEYSRKVDAVSRWSGEEFLIVLPESDQDGAYLMAENLREKIEDHDFTGVPGITASFGVDVFKENDEVDDLLSRVGAALENAKQNGRNRVETFS